MKAPVVRLFCLLALFYSASAEGICRKAGVDCVASCDGVASGNYHSCESCMAYTSCVGDTIYANRPCPGGQAWDDGVKRCVPDSNTCGPCVAVAGPEKPAPVSIPPTKPTRPPTKPRPQRQRGDVGCRQRGGRCINVCRYKKACRNGALYAGLCGGPSTRRCCLPGNPDWLVKNGGNFGGNGAAGLTNNCLSCIGEAAGGVKKVGKCTSVCGPYALTHAYWADCCNRGTYRQCATRMACSRRCVRAYLAKYSNGVRNSCEYYARVHRGGPYGWNSWSTNAFWGKVNKCCKRKRRGC